jgi:hypothetical protein
MKRDTIALLVITTLLLILSGEANAQTDETRKFELGVHFSSLSIGDDEGRTAPGFGGRFTFNLTDNFALEAEGNFFPKRASFSPFRTGGRAVEGLFGVKIGKRYKRFGVFGKARPGLISFSEGLTEFFPSTTIISPDTFFTVRTHRLTHFAADVGAVLELYVSRRIFTRFDAGDTIIKYGDTTSTSTTFSGVVGGPFTQTQFTIPGKTTHNFQFNAGVGFRF